MKSETPRIKGQPYKSLIGTTQAIDLIHGGVKQKRPETSNRCCGNDGALNLAHLVQNRTAQWLSERDVEYNWDLVSSSRYDYTYHLSCETKRQILLRESLAG